MEIKLKTAKGPKLHYSSPAVLRELGEQMKVSESRKIVTDSVAQPQVDHGLDEKNLLSIFSSLFHNLVSLDEKTAEVPQIALLCKVFSLLEAKYLPHTVVLIKSQVAKGLIEATVCSGLK
jgi:hypothetical protein